MQAAAVLTGQLSDWRQPWRRTETPTARRGRRTQLSASSGVESSETPWTSCCPRPQRAGAGSAWILSCAAVQYCIHAKADSVHAEELYLNFVAFMETVRIPCHTIGSPFVLEPHLLCDFKVCSVLSCRNEPDLQLPERVRPDLTYFLLSCGM